MNKEKIEIKVFKEFATHHPDKLNVNSLRNVPPPKPDIEIDCQNGETIAFEISEILDRKMMSRFQSSVSIEKLCAEYYRKLPNKQNKIFSKKYGNSFIHITFQENITLNKRQKSISSIFDYLLLLNPIQKENTPSDGLKRTVQKIVIRNTDSLDPDFGVDRWGKIENPLIERMNDKFSKSKNYSINHPIELLLFYNLQPEAHEFIFDHACNHAQAKIHQSNFQRIWIYSWTKDAILRRIDRNSQLITNQFT